MSAPDPRGSLHSSMREEYVEYIVLGGLCRAAWARGVPMEILRSATDAYGYDVVLSVGSALRHVQLKSSLKTGKTARQPINRILEAKAGACVVWTILTDDLRLDHFRWFGRAPHDQLVLPDRKVKHTKADATGTKAVRPAITAIVKGEFEQVSGYDALLERLFPTG